jgi:hypothetical protein
MATALDQTGTYVDGPDRRMAPRHRVLKGAKLSFNRGFGAFECVVRNLSEEGARLSFGETFAVPAAFDIVISGDTESRPAHVCWRATNAIGVQFD